MSEFARFAGVDHSAVSRAVKARDRLVNSVVEENGKIRIAVYDGCLEWHLNRDSRKNRKLNPTVIGSNDDEVMDPTESNRLQRHYDALIAQMNFEREAGKLISIDRFKAEAYTVGRGVRDAVMYVPDEGGRELKKLVIGFIRTRMGEDKVADFSNELDDMARSLLVFLKVSLKRTLRDLLHERFGTESLLEGGD